MSLKTTHNKFSTTAREAAAFFVPRNKTIRAKVNKLTKFQTAALIPTHGPTDETYNLIKSIMKWQPEVLIVVVDDNTPLEHDSAVILHKINNLSKKYKQVVSLRTPINTLKAGALNYGISYLMNLTDKPDVVFTFDDDVEINDETIPQMITALYSERHIGAVCSQVRVRNKNVNILTRLQGLEYHSFNMTKISDNGFLKGPLVMQGMLTAFKMSALNSVKGFSQGHLIEDYDITVRLKNQGWKVKIAQKAIAWTTIPETIEGLWKQRVRWTSGGLFVIAQYWKNLSSVYQDAIGHLLFLSLVSLIILSLSLPKSNHSNESVLLTLIAVSIFNFIVSFTFNAITMKMYQARDKYDWLIKFTILPELVYSNILSFILFGSYIFFIFNVISAFLAKHIRFTDIFYKLGLSVFRRAGFSSTWGTK